MITHARFMRHSFRCLNCHRYYAGAKILLRQKIIYLIFNNIQNIILIYFVEKLKSYIVQKNYVYMYIFFHVGIDQPLEHGRE